LRLRIVSEADGQRIGIWGLVGNRMHPGTDVLRLGRFLPTATVSSLIVRALPSRNGWMANLQAIRWSLYNQVRQEGTHAEANPKKEAPRRISPIRFQRGMSIAQKRVVGRVRSLY